MPPHPPRGKGSCDCQFFPFLLILTSSNIEKHWHFQPRSQGPLSSYLEKGRDSTLGTITWAFVFTLSYAGEGPRRGSLTSRTQRRYGSSPKNMSDRQRLFEVCCSCCISQEKLRSREIDKRIAEENRYRRCCGQTSNNLLLGAPGSGKSTFLEQANILFGKDFNNDELREFRPIIYGDILLRMKVLAYARRKLKLEWQDPSNQQHEDNILNFRAPQHIDTEKQFKMCMLEE